MPLTPVRRARCGSLYDVHMDSAGPLPKLPPRDPRGHKGTFGTVAVIGGSAHRPGDSGTGGAQMVGGPALAATAALRAGAGLARLVLPEPLLAAGLSIAPSATGVALAVDERGVIVPHKAAAVIDSLLESVQCIAIGPGLGRDEGATAAALRVVGQAEVAAVVDADAINCLSDVPDLQRDFRAAAILTPHVGEASRLGEALGVGADPREEGRREEAAGDLARRLGCVIVLKAARTIVSDGHQTWSHDHPNSALGTAGTGDVLCGTIAGLVAQHFRPGFAGRPAAPGSLSLFDCARIGVVAHATAAQRWVYRRGASGGLLATDLLEEIPAAIESLRAAQTEPRP